MTRLLPLPLCALLLACGESAAGGTMPTAIVIRGLTVPPFSAQIAVLSNGDQYSCGPADAMLPDDIRLSCLSTLIADKKLSTGDLVPVRASEDDPARKALIVSLAPEKLQGEGQDLTLVVPPGSNYLMVVEVMTADGATPTAAGCARVSKVSDGDNPAVVLSTAVLAAPPCRDPRICDTPDCAW